MLFDSFQMNLLYMRSHVRISTYMVGMFLGFLYHSMQKKEEKVAYAYKVASYGERLEKTVVKAWESSLIRNILNVISTVCLMIPLCGFIYFDTLGIEKFSQEIKALFLSSFRTIYAFGFA